MLARILECVLSFIGAVALFVVCVALMIYSYNNGWHIAVAVIFGVLAIAVWLAGTMHSIFVGFNLSDFRMAKILFQKK